MSNVVYTCATTIQTALQSSVTLTSLDSEVPDVDTTNGIVIRKMALRERDFEIGHLAEVKPGILVVIGPQRCPPSAGNDLTDDVYYTIDVVIVSTDNWLREDGLQTYTQWVQNIRQYFNNRLTGWPSDAASGIVWQCWAETAESVNDWRWVQQGEATLGVRITLCSREPRG